MMQSAIQITLMLKGTKTLSLVAFTYAADFVGFVIFKLGCLWEANDLYYIAQLLDNDRYGMQHYSR